MGIRFSGWVENLVGKEVESIVGKEEIARHEQFLLFLKCFQKLSIVDALKWISMA